MGYTLGGVNFGQKNDRSFDRSSCGYKMAKNQKTRNCSLMISLA